MMSVTVGGGPGMLVMGVTQSHTVTHGSLHHVTTNSGGHNARKYKRKNLINLNLMPL